MREVQAVIFDLDNTLWDVGPVILRAEHAMLQFLTQRYPRVLERHTLESMRDVRARMALEHPAMRHDFTSVTVDIWAARAVGADGADLSDLATYNGIARAYQAAAVTLGDDPASVQAVAWIVARRAPAALAWQSTLPGFGWPPTMVG